MLTEVQNDILAGLDTLPAFRERGVWQGDLEKLLTQVQKLPSAHVALAAGNLNGALTKPYSKAPMRLGWDVIIAYECLKDRRASADQGYGLIETVMMTLGGLKTQGGVLVPEGFDLLDTINGKAAYAVRFNIIRDL